MLKLKFELCAQLLNANHPYFKVLYLSSPNGNILDPCPMSVCMKKLKYNIASHNGIYSQGHRYIKPQVSTYNHFPLVPIGEWRVDFIVSTIINKSEDEVLRWSDFYEIKPTSAIEF